MKYIARAPVEVLGRDYRPGDTFGAEPEAVAAALAAGHVEAVVEAVAPEPAVTPPSPPVGKGKK